MSLTLLGSQSQSLLAATGEVRSHTPWVFLRLEMNKSTASVMQWGQTGVPASVRRPHH